MSGVTFLLIPCDVARPLRSMTLDDVDDDSDERGGDRLPAHLEKLLSSNNDNHGKGGGGGGGEEFVVEVTPLKRMSSSSSNNSNDGDGSGVYAYHYRSTKIPDSNSEATNGNVRATKLAMTCGLLSRRFYGDVYVSRLGHASSSRKLTNLSMDPEEDGIDLACTHGPDVRRVVISARTKLEPFSLDRSDEAAVALPEWLADAAKCNYEDSASLSALANVMTKGSRSNPYRDGYGYSNSSDEESDDDDDSSSSDGDGDDDSLTEKLRKKQSGDDGDVDDDNHNVTSPKSSIRQTKKNDGEVVNIEPSSKTSSTSKKQRATKVPLCLHCRRPADSLCTSCGGAYFCDLHSTGRSCIIDGWSHQCICQIWSIYTRRRKKLSKFPFLWHEPLITPTCQTSSEPYKDFLKNTLCVLYDETGPVTRADMWWDDTISSYWDTEIDGWHGGNSDGASYVDPSVRRSYRRGFRLDDQDVPDERPVSKVDAALCMIREDGLGLLDLKSWKDYYSVRRIPLTSPVALLCTFPLTVYHAIRRYGAVPITVSKMLNRPMRLHVLGIEKEINFLDLFKEVGFLLPEEVKVEMVFVIREDMLPPNCEVENSGRGYSLNLELTPNLSLTVQSGSYADTLDPSFDCGTGPPDMIIGLNAGLFAYESWRSVVEYLNANTGVVGVFTDYNEHSAVNCASLGGGKARESVVVNPFRQPRTMPVYSMNLPQFSNGFMYVYNEQELDI